MWVWICSMGTMGIVHVQCKVGPWQKGRKEGVFSARFSGTIIFSMELYLGDQLCSKCTKKSFVSYSVNEIKAYKYNILMTLQSDTSKFCYSDSRDISMYCGKAGYRPSTCIMIMCPVILYMWVFWKVDKVSPWWKGRKEEINLPAETELLEIAWNS